MAFTKVLTIADSQVHIGEKISKLNMKIPQIRERQLIN
jgi:hypothetical protein